MIESAIDIYMISPFISNFIIRMREIQRKRNIKCMFRDDGISSFAIVKGKTLKFMEEFSLSLREKCILVSKRKIEGIMSALG